MLNIFENIIYNFHTYKMKASSLIKMVSKGVVKGKQTKKKKHILEMGV